MGEAVAGGVDDEVDGVGCYGLGKVAGTLGRMRGDVDGVVFVMDFVDMGADEVGAEGGDEGVIVVRAGEREAREQAEPGDGAEG